MKFGLLNVRYVMNKVHMMYDFCVSEKLDNFAICETWIHFENTFVHDQLRPSDY